MCARIFEICFRETSLDLAREGKVLPFSCFQSPKMLILEIGDLTPKCWQYVDMLVVAGLAKMLGDVASLSPYFS